LPVAGTWSIIARLIPKTRELKAIKCIFNILTVWNSKVNPENKGTERVLCPVVNTKPAPSIARLIPKTRELKDAAPSGNYVAPVDSKVNPENKGTESSKFML